MVKPIIKYPNASLRVPTRLVEWPLTPELLAHIQDMQDTVAADKNALAVASNQVDEHGYRVFVVNGAVAKRLGHAVFINPSWESVMNAGQLRINEGCLSFPGTSFEVLRNKSVKLNFTSQKGEVLELVLNGLDAQMAQHECDHLDGKMVIDRIDKYKQVDFRNEFIRRRKAGRW